MSSDFKHDFDALRSEENFDYDPYAKLRAQREIEMGMPVSEEVDANVSGHLDVGLTVEWGWFGKCMNDALVNTNRVLVNTNRVLETNADKRRCADMAIAIYNRTGCSMEAALKQARELWRDGW